MIKIILSKGGLEVPPVKVEHGRVSRVQGQDVHVAGGGLDEVGKDLVNGDIIGGVPPWYGTPLGGRHKELKQEQPSIN